MILQWLTEEENAKLEQSRNAFELLSKEYSEYKDSHSYSNEDYSVLKKFHDETLSAEYEAKINEVLDRFSDLADNEEFKDICSRAHEFSSVEDLEKECFAIKGKIAMNFSKTSKKPTAVKVAVSTEDPAPGELYGGLFERFGRKH